MTPLGWDYLQPCVAHADIADSLQIAHGRYDLMQIATGKLCDSVRSHEEPSDSMRSLATP